MSQPKASTCRAVEPGDNLRRTARHDRIRVVRINNDKIADAERTPGHTE
ncbi:hypothetical protein [Frankia sp. Cas3]|nr:hypothetical protein [Frankia sp. Cas3]